MITKLKKLVGRLLSRQNTGNGIVSYSQEGEDMVLRRFVGDSAKGFYVDIGAHHPSLYSNTNYFYQRGWSGINIDADPTLMNAFAEDRTRDINLAAGIATDTDDLTFYLFNDRALNTFNPELAKERSELEHYHIIEEVKIKVQPLRTLLEAHLPEGQVIDFMSVDTESLDLDVLRSNNWSKFRPRYVLVECLEISDLSNIAADPVAIFLTEKNYKPVAKTFYTVLFEDCKK